MTGRLLALDFEGVVCDALIECAAVTFAAAQASRPVPTLADTVPQLSSDYLDRFASVRPYSRTLADFMVTNVIDQPLVSRVDFTTAWATAGSGVLWAQAARAREIRNLWRTRESTAWLDMHVPYEGLAGLIGQGARTVAIVSSKDAKAIDAVLEHFGLRGNVSVIVGDCLDKPAAVRALMVGGTATFVDDNITNVLAVATIPGVRSLWATWGYHSAEDLRTAEEQSVTSVSLAELATVA